MTISLQTTIPAYWNDICEIIRLFYGMPEIIRDDTCEAELRIAHTADGGRNHASIRGDHTVVMDEPFDEQSRKAVKICVYRALFQYTRQNMPWGSLTGVRPVKLFHELGAGAYDIFTQTYDVSPEKAGLTRDVANNQLDIIQSASLNDLDIYIHIPFCKTRCAYCSFSSIGVEKKGKYIPKYIDALIRELYACGESALREGFRPRTVYIGGGTPTAIPAESLDTLLAAVNDVFGNTDEFTVEAGRPDTIDRDKLDVLSRRGVTRISINPQTMNEKTLAAIGRGHTTMDVAEAFGLAKSYGFIINADVIAGLPGEDADDMRHTLEALEKLEPDNITVHTLCLKRASAMKSGGVLPWDNQCVAEQVRLAYAFCESVGMRPYYLYRQKYMAGNLENTGFARDGTRCVYNVDIMQENVNILALGAGAVSKRVYSPERFERAANPKDIELYIEREALCADRKIKVFTNMMNAPLI